MHSDVLKNYALSNVASGICKENELVLPAYSYAALFALRTIDRKVEEEEADEEAKEAFDAKEDVTEDECAFLSFSVPPVSDSELHSDPVRILFLPDIHNILPLRSSLHYLYRKLGTDGKI